MTQEHFGPLPQSDLNRDKDVKWLAAQDLDPGRLRYGFAVGETLYFTSNGTFNKADYPGLRAVRVKAQGGGGAGGGSNATGAGQVGVGGGGGGGGYAEKLILADDLGASETITRGAGGTGVSAGTGNTGGASSFGSHFSASGGVGGSAGGPIAPLSVFANGGEGGGATGDFDLGIVGSSGENGLATATNRIHPGRGGGSILGSARSHNVVGTGSSGGNAGRQYGGGGTGAATGVSVGAATGGNGAAGIVIVELLY